METILVSTALLALAIYFLVKIRTQPYISPYRVLIYLSIIGAVYVAAALGLQLWSMFQGEAFKAALVDFANKYPTVLAEDLGAVISVVERSSYWMGFGRGLLVGGAATLLLTITALKKVIRPVRAAKPVEEGEE